MMIKLDQRLRDVSQDFACSLFNPQRQAAALAQARFVGRPVLHLKRHLRDVVAAGGVVFVLVWTAPDGIDVPE